MLRIFVFLLALTPLLRAQDISGAWQASIGSAKEHHRLILQVDRAEDADWTARLYLIDDSPDGFLLPSFSKKAKEISFELPQLKLSYQGTLSSDGNSISGRMVWDGKGSLTFARATPDAAWPHDIHCSCSTSFVPIQKGVKLEVLDWGGTGRPLVLLAGLGATAHDFDVFAHKLAERYHVYGITRRGYGDSSSPPATEANYNADRLGDDVLAVLDAPHLQQRPVLIGHSIAGEELSSVGSRHPEKVAALIYLDAAYGYAFYNSAYPDPDLDLLAFRKQLDELLTHEDPEKTSSGLLAALPSFQKTLEAEKRLWAGVPGDSSHSSDDSGLVNAILLGQRRYTNINVPLLAIFANPHKLHDLSDYDAAGRAALAKSVLDRTTTAINALKTGIPAAHVVVIPNADHFVYVSNEAEVVREINAFLTTLAAPAVPHAP